jgi:Protein of unknown function (DUF1656)
MIAEFDIYGVFVPALLVYAIAALLLELLLRRGLDAIGFYRFVWHRPLFDLALVVILFGVVVAFAEPVIGFLRHHIPWIMA